MTRYAPQWNRRNRNLAKMLTITCLVLCLFFTFEVCLSEKVTTMRLCPGLQLNSSDVLLEIQVTHQLECSRACGRNDKCQSATFNSGDSGHTCRLHATTVNCGDLPADSRSDVLTFFEPRCVNGGTWKYNDSKCIGCDHGFTGTYCERRIMDCEEGRQLGYSGDEKILIQPLHAEQPFMTDCIYFFGNTRIEHRGRTPGCETPASFNRTWDEYRDGFGDLNCDYFIGLENVHLLTTQRKALLKVRIYNGDTDQKMHMVYRNFYVDNEASSYRVRYTDFKWSSSNPGGDGFGLASLNNTKFCTRDRDCGSCAEEAMAGWWYNPTCTGVNLNIPWSAEKRVVWPNATVDPYFVTADSIILSLRGM